MIYAWHEVNVHCFRLVKHRHVVLCMMRPVIYISVAFRCLLLVIAWFLELVFNSHNYNVMQSSLGSYSLTTHLSRYQVLDLSVYVCHH